MDGYGLGQRGATGNPRRPPDRRLWGHGAGMVMFNLDGSGYQWIGPGGSYYNAAPSWTPSGTALAFGLTSGGVGSWIYTSDLSGAERPLIPAGDSGLTLTSWPAYSHDGAYVYFSGATTANFGLWRAGEVGRGACRERGEISVVAGSLKKKKK